MTTNKDLKNEFKKEKYDFIRTFENERNIILLGIGGSRGYGTDNKVSDWDWRGIALNSKMEILTNQNFDQLTNEETDTTIYSFNKIISLLTNCNPNVIELLGLKPEHYLYISPIGKELLDNRHLFLSKKCIHSFGGYATSQLRRLDSKAARLVSQTEQEQHILNSIKNASYDFKARYFAYDDDAMKLYIDKSESEEYESEIFMDVNLKHYPLRDYKGMWSVMNNIVKEYGKIGKRNQNAIEHNKLSKHMMHLVRLYLMCLDILNNGEIVTYREKDHDFLMEIRNGKYLDDNRQPTPEFFDIVDELEARLDQAKHTTELPDNPDYNTINKFVASVNERIVKGEI
jgi:predicted nucleotidyltransferase